MTDEIDKIQQYELFSYLEHVFWVKTQKITKILNKFTNYFVE